jgi:3-phenylpropionate/trans-cinnamate dioxygenase ferredoxin component
MADELPVCAVSELTPGTVMGAGHYAVGNAAACSPRAAGVVTSAQTSPAGPSTSRTVSCAPGTAPGTTSRPVGWCAGPQGVYAKVPGLGSADIAPTRVFPLRRGKVVERDATVLVR